MIKPTDIERFLERGLFASRWLMAPFYVGLVIALFGAAGRFPALLWSRAC